MEHLEDLVMDSVTQIMLGGEEVGEKFYARLFEIAPHLAHLFSQTSARRQWMMFVDVLNYSVEIAAESEAGIRRLTRLGKYHVDYGASPEDYGFFRDALLWTLKQQMREKYSSELEEAWITVFDQTVKTMLQAA